MDYDVIKANKIREPFSEEKVRQSIRRAGISSTIQEKVLQHVKSKLYDDISTAEIYKHILEFLGKSETPFARARYSLKEAIMDLGPTGYPFEDFISKILDSLGYTTKVRQILMGECVTHEIDVIASKDGKNSMIEAKFHNNPGIRSQIHVALYTQARFEDVRVKNQLDEAWIVTNTKTTTEVNAYAQCKGMKIVSWNYPDGESLRDLIESSGLHPITLLNSLSHAQKNVLLENHIIMCKDIELNPKSLDILPLSKEDKTKIISEASFVCRIK